MNEIEIDENNDIHEINDIDEIDEIYDINQINDIINSSDNEIYNSKCRYENIINILGLNLNIDYPINVLIDGVIQLHTTVLGEKIYKFNNNKLSKKVEYLLFDKYYIGKNHTYIKIKNKIKDAYKYYKFNVIINNKTVKNNKKSIILGFNHEYSRWIPLQSYEIE
jgi:hypothetical protein